MNRKTPESFEGFSCFFASVQGYLKFYRVLCYIQFFLTNTKAKTIMLKLSFRITIFCIATGLLIGACNTGSSSPTLNNKQDSLSFARDIIKLYEAKQAGPSVSQQEDTLLQSAGPVTDGMQPIGWDTFEKYKKYYDDNPLLFNPQKQAYKGFVIDTAGYKMLMANAEIKGLYLRLGRKEDGAYTIMILGTNASGQVIQTSGALINTSSTDPSNFDQLKSCPVDCPDIDNL